MNISETYNLKWFEFREHLSANIKDLQHDEDFTDVTLVSEENHPIAAHKVILAASSPFFKNILKKNKHTHPLIYMRGIKGNFLSAIVEFLYNGETSVNAKDLDMFLAIADDLELKGLANRDKVENRATNYEDNLKLNLENKIPKLRSELASIELIDDTAVVSNTKIEVQEDDQSVEQPHTEVSFGKSTSETNFPPEETAIEAAVESILKKVNGKYGQGDGKWICIVCNKIFKKKSHIKDHAARHIRKGNVAPHSSHCGDC